MALVNVESFLGCFSLRSGARFVAFFNLFVDAFLPMMYAITKFEENEAIELEEAPKFVVLTVYILAASTFTRPIVQAVLIGAAENENPELLTFWIGYEIGYCLFESQLLFVGHTTVLAENLPKVGYFLILMRYPLHFYFIWVVQGYKKHLLDRREAVARLAQECEDRDIQRRVGGGVFRNSDARNDEGGRNGNGRPRNAGRRGGARNRRE